MNRCLITYEEIPSPGYYSIAGLKTLSRQLQMLHPLTLSAEDQRREAALRMGKMSIAGVQPKLSAVLNQRAGCFEIVDTDGKYILKPQAPFFRELPENEDLTMHLAKVSGIEVPTHGLVPSRDGSLTYFIRRMDRIGAKRKFAMEDFAQLMGESRDTKYRSSMERLISVIETHCTFPLLDKIHLFHRTVFNYLVGNEDMHLKNFSLITRDDRVEMAPAYDFLNSTIVLDRPQEEIALPINGKKSGLSREVLLTYFARERLDLSSHTIDDVMTQIETALPQWGRWIDHSLLSDEMKQKYRDLLETRCRVMKLQ